MRIKIWITASFLVCMAATFVFGQSSAHAPPPHSSQSRQNQRAQQNSKQSQGREDSRN